MTRSVPGAVTAAGRPCDDAEDVHRTLTFSDRKLARQWLWLGIPLLVLGPAIAALHPPRLASYDGAMLAITLILGIGITGFALARTIWPGPPLLVLSPQGLRQRIPWVKEVMIPWREVLGVDTVDIAARFRGQRVVFPRVTVVLVSRAFYDRHIHVGSWLLRGPGWDANYVLKDALAQVALHHDMLPATAEELRRAVETRWRAFGPRTASHPA